MENLTPLPNPDQTLDIIDHVNTDHPEELLLVVRTLAPFPAATRAQITAIYLEGMAIVAEQAGKTAAGFIPFRIKGDVEEQILYLMYLAQIETGRRLAGQKRYFEVLGSRQITSNILRLEIKSEQPLPTPGHALWFALRTMKKIPPPEGNHHANFLQRWGNRALLWGLKHLSSSRRKKILQRFGQGGRYYTLRRVWQGLDSPIVNCASVDIFLHGTSAGAEWAKGLHPGDIIASHAETASHHQHLHHGKTLLIADETAYGALAGILAAWQNPIPPHVLILSAAESEQQYFANRDFPVGSTVKRIVCPVTIQGARIQAAIEKIPALDAVWGALENEVAKRIRYFLRHEYQLTGKNNHIKGYWQKK